jgi:hypothetical protein
MRFGTRKIAFTARPGTVGAPYTLSNKQKVETLYRRCQFVLQVVGCPGTGNHNGLRRLHLTPFLELWALARHRERQDAQVAFGM